MTTGTQQRAGETRLSAYSAEIPRGSTFQLIAAWLLLTEGGVGLLFLPIIVFSTKTNVPVGDITGFTVGCVACLVGGGLLYSRWTWSVWLAVGVAVAVTAWLLSTGGLTSISEGYIAAAFGVVVVALLALGRRAGGNPEAMAIASANIPFRLKVTIVWVAIFLLIGLSLALFHLDIGWIKTNVHYISVGVIYTMLLAVASMLLALVLALFGSMGRLSKNPVAYSISGFYTSFFRGTPLIVQLFFIYAALPQIGSPHNLDRLSLVNILTLTVFQVGVVGIGLNYGAYMTEIFRAGIQSVGHGQSEAADALGMSYWQRMRRVVLPQATRVIIPPVGNDFIALMKDTALVAFIGVEISRADLFTRAQLAGEQDYRRLESLLVAAAMYWALTAIFTFFQSKLERRMSKGYVRAGQRLPKPRPHLVSAGGPGGPRIQIEPPVPPELGEEPGQ